LSEQYPYLSPDPYPTQVYFYSTLYALASRVAYAQMPRGSLRDELDSLVESVFANDMKIQETLARDQLDAHRHARRKEEGGRLRRLYRWMARALGVTSTTDSSSLASQSVASMSINSMAWENPSESPAVGRQGSGRSYALMRDSPVHQQHGGAVAREGSGRGSGGSGRGVQFDDLSVTNGSPFTGTRSGGTSVMDSMQSSPMVVSAYRGLPRVIPNRYRA
jgi:hypothetical protein